MTPEEKENLKFISAALVLVAAAAAVGVGVVFIFYHFDGIWGVVKLVSLLLFSVLLQWAGKKFQDED